jgi:conjugative transfer region lipoprotein (TIGR03751 family)
MLGGCATSKDTVLPKDGPSMQAIYAAHFAGIGAQGPEALRELLGPRPLADADTDLAGYTRSAYNELNTVFPRLPNPTLVMYVFPHLAEAERVPVPGYATTFTLYERVEYALPGEVP